MSMEFGEAICTLAVMAIPISAIVTSHLRKMAEIKARSGNLTAQSPVTDEVRMQLAAMREDISSLRDTTTKFDMSFDAAVSRLEQRVDRIEEDRATTGTTASPPLRTASPAQTDMEQVTVLGRKG